MDNLNPEIAALINAARAKAVDEGRAVEVAPGDVWAFRTAERAEAFAAKQQARA